MRKAVLGIFLLSLLAIGLTLAESPGIRLLASQPDVAASNSLTPEQKAALAAIDARLAGVEAIAAKIDEPGYKADVARQIDDLKKSRLAIEKNFDQGAYEALMHSVISRYQVIALWLKPPALPPPVENALTPAEAEAGWTLLFDGKSLAGWRGYRSKTVPGSWRVENGSLLSRHEMGVSSGDIITIDQFDNFELLVDWKMTKGYNSGIFYRATEDHDHIWQSGPEYQIVDNSRRPDGLNPLATAGACYAVFAPAKDMTRPVGEWNTARIVALGKHVEHWLNGVKVVEYDVDSDVWKSHVNTSKFISLTYGESGWGRAKRGHIGLQDYGRSIEFRNIKIRLPAQTTQ